MEDDDQMFSTRIFTFMRHVPFPTMYGENKTPASEYVLEVGWIVAFCSVAFSVYVIALVQPKPLHVIIRTSLALLLGLIIMLCNFGQKWEVGQLRTPTPYKPGTPTEIHADIGVLFGLRGVNITLKADSPPADLANETINYNEHFSWVWSQGRAGFGQFAGRVQQDFRYHQRRGTPVPILWVAEYLTFDGEGIRFGRHYRLAGWYAHILLWAALPAWLLTVILCNMVVQYMAAMLSLTGACLTTAAILWASVRNPIELTVPFDPPHGILTTRYGAHWYLALVVGILCMVGGLLIFLLDFIDHDLACRILGINPIAYLEEEYEAREGVENKAVVEGDTDIEMAEQSKPPVPVALEVRYRSRGASRRNWKTQQISAAPSDLRHLPPPPPTIPVYDDLAPSHFPPPPPTDYPQIQITPTPPAGAPEEPLYGNVLPQQRARLPHGDYENAPLHPAPPPPRPARH